MNEVKYVYYVTCQNCWDTWKKNQTWTLTYPKEEYDQCPVCKGKRLIIEHVYDPKQYVSNVCRFCKRPFANRPKELDFFEIVCGGCKDKTRSAREDQDIARPLVKSEVYGGWE